MPIFLEQNIDFKGFSESIIREKGIFAGGGTIKKSVYRAINKGF